MTGVQTCALPIFGHLGDLSDLTLAGTLSGVQMGLQLAGVPIRAGGVDAALEVLKQK